MSNSLRFRTFKGRNCRLSLCGSSGVPVQLACRHFNKRVIDDSESMKFQLQEEGVVLQSQGHPWWNHSPIDFPKHFQGHPHIQDQFLPGHMVHVHDVSPLPASPPLPQATIQGVCRDSRISICARNQNDQSVVGSHLEKCSPDNIITKHDSSTTADRLHKEFTHSF